MAIRYEIEKHAVAFPSRILAGIGGKHQENIRLTKDMDNGAVINIGNYIALGEFTQGGEPTAFEAEVVDTTLNGNFLIRVLNAEDAYLIFSPEIIAQQNFSHDFKKASNYFNEAGQTVLGYELTKNDYYEISALGFDDKVTPAKGMKLGIKGGKLVATTKPAGN